MDPIQHPTPKYTIITDAALQGWGATLSLLEKPKISRLPNQAPENLQVQPFPSKIIPDFWTMALNGIRYYE
jgi:hypothetical protein